MRTDTEFAYPHPALKRHWLRLHAGDREPFPSAALIARLAKGHPPIAEAVSRQGGAAAVAAALEDAWRAFHRGDFAVAIRDASKVGALGVLAANKAAASQASYIDRDERRRLAVLRAAVERGEEAVSQLPELANAHFALALALGRLSQRISILEALAAGYGGRIRSLLERTLEIEPKHAEAHIAMGLFHAELIRTLGSLAARLTYGASEQEAIGHFRDAVRLAPKLVAARVEFAHGLRLLGGKAHAADLEKLQEQASALQPMDRLDTLDLERLRQAHAH